MAHKYGMTLRDFLLKCIDEWLSARWKVVDEAGKVLTEDLMDLKCSDPILDRRVRAVYKNVYAVVVRVYIEE